MQINLTFNSLDELHDYCKLALLGMAPRDDIKPDTKLAAVPETLAHNEAIAEPLNDEAAEEASDVQPEPTKRKRRTKAEIEADKAAQASENTLVAAEAPAAVVAPHASPLDNLQSEVDTAMSNIAILVGASVEIPEMARLFDGTDKLAHLNEGRQFIEKYGFPTYGETLQLADVSANIASLTPEQVSRHRAAMVWKAAQKAGG